MTETNTSPADATKAWRTIKLQPGAELIVGWRPRRSRLDAAPVELSTPVADEMHALAQRTLDRLDEMTARPSGGNPALEAGEEYLLVRSQELRPAAASVPSDRNALPDDEATDLADLQRLVAATGLPALTRDDLRDGHYLFYAVVCGTAAGQRIGFVRQIDPHRVEKSSTVTAMFGAQGLRRLTEPVFVFEGDFDLVVEAELIAVLRLEAFNRLFADFDTIAAAAPANAAAIAAHVRNLAPAGIDALIEAAKTSRSLARKLMRLGANAESLPTIDAKAIRDALAKHGLDPATLVTGRQITFGVDGALMFVDLVDQVFYEADFTGEHRRADRYSTLPPTTAG